MDETAGERSTSLELLNQTQPLGLVDDHNLVNLRGAVLIPELSTLRDCMKQQVAGEPYRRRRLAQPTQVVGHTRYRQPGDT